MGAAGASPTIGLGRLARWLVALSMLLGTLATPWSYAEAGPPPSCRVAVAVEGDSVLAMDLRGALADRGLDTAPAPGCPTVRARVFWRGESLHVVVEDAAGRRSERIVSNTATAASVVESWVRSDLSAPLLPTPEVSFPVSPAGGGPSPSVTAASAPPRRGLGISLALIGETSFGSEGSVWAGLSASACVQLGLVCAGVLGRYQHTLTTSEIGHSTRSGFDVLVVAELPLRWRRVVFTPGLGVGVGWLSTTSGTVNRDRETESIDAGGLRTSVHLALAVPLLRRLALQIHAALDVAPTARTDRVRVDEIDLPGEPRLYGRGGLGLRYLWP